jgi:hypothetical protein
VRGDPLRCLRGYYEWDVSETQPGKSDSETTPESTLEKTGKLLFVSSVASLVYRNGGLAVLTVGLESEHLSGTVGLAGKVLTNS